MKNPIQSMLRGSVQHEVKVTRIPGHGYGVRVLVNGVVNQEDIAPSREMIGPVARSMLRMEDKCGNVSNHAHRARFRVGEKGIRRQAIEAGNDR